MKKNINIRMESFRRPIAENKVEIIFLRGFIVEIVLSGLSTRKERKEFKFTLEVLKKRGKYAELTIIKSKIFQKSFR